jgi:uncharacterized repeat protein (TIGR01451 family)
MKRKMKPAFSIFRDTRSRRASASSMALVLFVAQVSPALATIDNTATASGTYGANPATTATSNQVKVPVAPAVATLLVTKSAASPTVINGANTSQVDAGDTILFTYTVKNTGNVTMTGVSPTDVGPKFNGINGTGTLGAFSGGTSTLLPGQTSANFFATYTLTTLDVDRGAGISGGVTNTASATATPAFGPLGTVTTGSASTTIPANPALSVVKSYVIADIVGGTALKADVGEVVTYTYKVKNTGSVPMTDVTISDLHVATTFLSTATAAMKNETVLVGDDGPLAPGVVSSDATAADGKWTTLQPGATVTFTWAHTVTQAEYDAALP